MCLWTERWDHGLNLECRVEEAASIQTHTHTQTEEPVIFPFLGAKHNLAVGVLLYYLCIVLQ